MKKIAFTIVLNGMPFIQKQAEILPKVFDEWHIIEGATLPVKDTAWCQNIDNRFYADDKLSVDGTTEFIDSIVDNKKVFVHRKGDFWNGKTEMCAQIEPLMKNCILMQFDVDEIWTIKTLTEVLDYVGLRKYDVTSPKIDGMLFRCNYYVGPNLITTGSDCYGNNPGEWCRLWIIRDQTTWKSHEPPRIHGLTDFLSRERTEMFGWTFDHYAYVLESQLMFKENFYGYTGALENWKRLQMNRQFPVFLRNFLPWVKDGTGVDLKK
jgi:hypothetical protein